RHTRFSRDWSSDVCSSDLMWRSELAQPMPLHLPVEAQVAWLREHASVAEFSRSYELIDPRAAGAGASLPWDATSPWAAAFEAQSTEERRVGEECRVRKAMR